MNPDSPLFARDQDGLVIGIPHPRLPDGSIDWRRLVPTSFLYVPKDLVDKAVAQHGKSLTELESDLSQVDDRFLRIKLGGINYLAWLRGYTSLTYPHLAITDNKAAACCQMTFIGNYETGGQPITCASIGSATAQSVSLMMRPYLETTAENRAFVRCVKRALKINILGEDEIPNERANENDFTPPVPTGFEPNDIFAKNCRDRGITFETIREASIAIVEPTDKQPFAPFTTNPATWESFKSIGNSDGFFLIGRMEAKEKQLAEEKLVAEKAGESEREDQVNEILLGDNVSLMRERLPDARTSP